jgi:hypothetical protein
LLLASGYYTCMFCCRSQRQTDLSSDPDRSMRPSFDQETEVTGMLQHRCMVSCCLCAYQKTPGKAEGFVSLHSTPVWCAALGNPSGLDVPDDHLPISTASCIRWARSSNARLCNGPEHQIKHKHSPYQQAVSLCG